MSWTPAKADTLAISADSFHTAKKTATSDVTAFEAMLNTNAQQIPFYYVAKKESPDEEGYCAYKELVWDFTEGPFPSGVESGWNFVIRNFKAKEADYGDETKYVNLVVEKVTSSSYEDEELARTKMDLFLDAFKANIDGKLE